MLHETQITEDFLQFVWEQKLFNGNCMKTVTGEKTEVLDPGLRNRDSGPDFFNARVRIGTTLWAGNIEIHKNSSDWKKHHHQDDGSYNNIILHVVLHYDTPVKRTSGEEIPALVLDFPDHLYDNYRLLMNSSNWIPCQEKFRSVNRLVMKIGFNRLMIERLQERRGEIVQSLQMNAQDWNETFYHFLARNFGFKTNAVPFELLAKSVPHHILEKHQENILILEALLFGQSGLLHQELLGDDYFLKLRADYEFFAKKYHLKPIPGHLWKFLRLRPVNFPTIRIAQFAALIQQAAGLFSRISESPVLPALRNLFHVKASDYWTNHYKFSQPSRSLVKHLGNSSIDNIIINTVVPVIFVYGETTGNTCLRERALEWLGELPPEENSVMDGWSKLGVEPESAFESQALLQLRNRYCLRKRCLHCHIGTRIIKEKG